MLGLWGIKEYDMDLKKGQVPQYNVRYFGAGCSLFTFITCQERNAVADFAVV